MERISMLEIEIGELYYAILYAGNLKSKNLLINMQNRKKLELEELQQLNDKL